MSITLQSTVGGFSAEFLRKLPALEKALIAHGLEPEQFETSNITEPNDIRFLGYFYTRCIATDNLGDNLEDNAEDNVDPEPAPRPGLINRVFRWMTQPV